MGNKNIELDKLTLLEKLELLYELELKELTSSNSAF